jgi:hypothetical protein
MEEHNLRKIDNYPKRIVEENYAFHIFNNLLGKKTAETDIEELAREAIEIAATFKDAYYKYQQETWN